MAPEAKAEEAAEAGRRKAEAEAPARRFAARSPQGRVVPLACAVSRGLVSRSLSISTRLPFSRPRRSRVAAEVVAHGLAAEVVAKEGARADRAWTTRQEEEDDEVIRVRDARRREDARLRRALWNAFIGTVLLVASIAWLGGCGRDEAGRQRRAQSSDSELMAALRSMNHRRRWSRKLEPYRDVVTELRGGKSGARRIGQDDMRSHLADADVVLCADFHDQDVHRLTFRRVVSLLAPWCDGPVLIAIEAVPSDRQRDLEAALRSGQPAAVRAVLRKEWPYPVEAYVDMLLSFHARGWLIRGMGKSKATRRMMPSPATPDQLRRPLPTSDPVTPIEVTDARVAGLVSRWLKDYRGAHAFVLFGAAHILGSLESQGLRREIERRGHGTLVVMPVLSELELAVHEILGPGQWHDWIWLAPGVFRAGVLRDHEWICASNCERERFNTTLAAMPESVTSENAKHVVKLLEMLHKTNRQRALPILKQYVNDPLLRRHSGLIEFYIRRSD